MQSERSFFFVRERIVAKAEEDPLAGALVRKLREADEESTEGVLELEGCLVFEPCAGRQPWGCIHFVGGAALGTVPGAVYSEFLQRLAESTGLGCIATPYELSLDHYAASYDTRTKFEFALAAAQSERGWPQAQFPVFGLGHSLGAKLLLLQREQYDRLVCCAPNNFGVSDSARLFRSFLQAMNEDASANGPAPWQNIFDYAVSAAEFAGIQVQPDPQTTLELLGRPSSTSTASNLPKKPELVSFLSFSDDTLDSTEDLLSALQKTISTDLQRLSGGHLECVYASQFGLGSILALDAVVSAVSKALTRPPPGPSFLPPPLVAPGT